MKDPPIVEDEKPDPVFNAPDPVFNASVARLLRREALRRAAEELNTTSGPGLESMLGRISADVTAEAAEKRTDPKLP
jgi:hypothetical protein